RPREAPPRELRLAPAVNETWVTTMASAPSTRRPSRHGKLGVRLDATTHDPTGDLDEGRGREHDQGGLGCGAEALVAVGRDRRERGQPDGREQRPHQYAPPPQRDRPRDRKRIEGPLESRPDRLPTVVAALERLPAHLLPGPE